MIPKFRAWDKESQTMLDVSLMDFKKSVLVGEHWKFGETNFMSFDDIKLMRSTGLKDKNDVEIFEGDLLSWNGETPHIVKFGQWICEDDLGYKIRNIGFYIDSSYDNTEWFQGIDYENTPIKFEIIGNIYENPELMEADDDTK